MTKHAFVMPWGSSSIEESVVKTLYEFEDPFIFKD